MNFDPDYLLNRDFPILRHSYNEKDCMLFALGVGMGIDPLDENCLRFVYEDGLKVLPSQSVVMAHPGFWAKEEDTGLDWVKVLDNILEDRNSLWRWSAGAYEGMRCYSTANIAMSYMEVFEMLVSGGGINSH